MSEVNQEELKSFLRCPNVLLYGRPQLPIQDKWALITLMGLCWDRYKAGKTLKELEGPYKLSLREIASITGVDHTALRRREGKNAREGVLDRLQAIGYLTYQEGRPVDEFTGKEGRAQTYLYVHLEKIWKDNEAFSKEGRLPANRLVAASSFHTVDQNNTHVDQNNVTVVRNNHTVDGVSSKSAQDVKTNKTVRQKDERVIPTIRQPITAPSHTRSSVSSRREEKQEVEQVRTFKMPEELTESIQHIHKWYHASPIAMGEYEQVTSEQEGYYTKIARYVTTEHAFTSLVTFEIERCSKKSDSTVYLGNLAGDVQAWKQTYKPPEQKSSKSSPVLPELEDLIAAQKKTPAQKPMIKGLEHLYPKPLPTKRPTSTIKSPEQSYREEEARRAQEREFQATSQERVASK